VYYHENDYFPPARLYMIEKLYNSQKKHNVVMVDYRGFGDSEGKCNEKGMLLDANAIIEYVFSMPEINPYKIVVFGAALGGVPATHATYNYQEKIKGLILQNTIPSSEHEGRSLLWFMSPFLSYISTSKLDNISIMPKLAIPVLFVKGLKDDMTTKDGLYLMYNEASNSVYRKMHEVANADHYSTWYHGGEEFKEVLTNFIVTCMGPSVQSRSEARLNLLKQQWTESKQEEVVKEDL